ncbi:hypothetical protein QTP70_006846 [Hemibagrus guttatus]|uniref:ribonuclease H n=1 Tax=Hemibagrus guttatus TaxID=175788 RepID=A0AAE0PZZ6_9TELE|nr:hypothetical protein QTP70_006846 [Hemibagrus guttatus]
MLVDSGSSVSLMSADFCMSVPTLRNRPLKKDYVSARAVNGQLLDTLGTITVTFQLGTESWQHVFHVLRETTQTVLLGWDFLLKNHALMDLSHAKLQLWDISVPLLTSKDFVPMCCNMSLAAAMNLPPLSESVVAVQVCSPNATHLASDFVGYLEPNVADSSGLVVAHTVATVHNGLTKARILNPTGQDISLKQGMHLGEFYSVDDSDVQLFHAPADITTATVSIVAPPVSLDESPISESERAALSALLLEYSDIFSSSKQNSGRCTLVKHHIRTGEQTPIKQRAYRASPEKRAEIEKQVAGLLADGVIEESCSPWVSPVVLVKKKCGTWRFCVDYRRLNSVTIKDSHPLPRVDDTLDALAGAVWFSMLDFSNGYWQVEVAEDDREKTAFTTGQGLYQWRSMPMGLSNAPATFQRLMELVLRGLPWHICMVYLDDILIYSKTFEEHLSSLKEVFLRIQSAGLKLNPSKCHLARDHVVFLGHVVSRKGLQPDPKNTEKVLNWPIPRSPSEVRAFVGLCSYYRRSKLAAPLNQLVGKNVPFVWTAECDKSFNRLKSVLSSDPVVILPDFSVAFKIYTDASNLAVGAVLAQDRDGLEHVVAYASRALNSTQKRWSTFDRELWAIVWAVREFKHYIGLASFTIITDHRPLLAIRRLSIDDPTGRRGRWILELDPLNWVIVHKDGKQHKNADALSRRPDAPSPSEAEASVEEVLEVNVSAQTVARCLFEDYVLIHGVPETLHSDQGRQFEAEVVQNLCHLLNIKKTRTTSYHPKSDGMVERFNRTLIDQLAKTLLTYGGEWDDYVKHVAFAYITTTHSTTRFTPYFLTHGREARVPTDVLLPTCALDSQMSASHAEFVSSLLTKLNSAFSSARMHGDAAHDRQKLYHDAGLRHQPYDVGVMVWLHNPVESRMKLAPHWKGPYKIAQVMDSCGEQGLTYRIENPFDLDERAQIVHYNRLRPYTLPVSPLSQNQTLSNARDSQPESLSLESGVSGGEVCLAE